MDARGSLEESQRELLASQRLKDRGKKSRVQLANVRDGYGGRCLKDLILGRVIYVQEEGGHLKGREIASSADRLSGDVFNRFAGIEPDSLLFAHSQALDH